MALNNTASEAKYNVSLNIDGSLGVLSSEISESIACHVETQLRIEVTGVGPTNEIQVYGRIRNSDLWHYIATITGAVTGIADIATYDFLRYFHTVADGTGKIAASGFIFSSTSTGQLTANEKLNDISNTLGPDWDRYEATFPNATQDVFTYKKDSLIVQVVTVTYQDSTKKIITLIDKIRY